MTAALLGIAVGGIKGSLTLSGVAGWGSHPAENVLAEPAFEFWELDPVSESDVTVTPEEGTLSPELGFGKLSAAVSPGS
jgi:hypothetical protein